MTEGKREKEHLEREEGRDREKEKGRKGEREVHRKGLNSFFIRTQSCDH
jgi:hypothetical protein